MTNSATPIPFEQKLLLLWKSHGKDREQLLNCFANTDYYNESPKVCREARENLLCINEFYKELSNEEKLFLLPDTYTESKELTERYSEGIKKDFILRPITGFANLNLELVDRMAEVLKGKRCLEICSGNGLLGRLLRDRGVDILCTDISEPKDNAYRQIQIEKPYTEILRMEGNKAVEEYGENIDVLVMSWIPEGSTVASEAAELLYEINSEATILWIGEICGCTGDEKFGYIIEKFPRSKISELDWLHVPCDGIHDCILEVRYDPNHDEIDFDEHGYILWDDEDFVEE